MQMPEKSGPGDAIKVSFVIIASSGPSYEREDELRRSAKRGEFILSVTSTHAKL
jgi:hypothetical protein